MSLWPRYCDCCQVRYATARYSTGPNDYCTECADRQPKKGAWQQNYAQIEQNFRDPHPGEVVYGCQCCQLGFTIQQVGTLFYSCGDSYDFCYKCALKHKVCPRHPDNKLKPEGLTQLQKLIRNNQYP